LSLLLGRVALARGGAGYRPSHQTFPWTICRSVGLSGRALVGLSSALWKNGGSDPDEADGGVWWSVHGKGYFWARISVQDRELQWKT